MTRPIAGWHLLGGVVALCLVALPARPARAGDCIDYSQFMHWEEGTSLPENGMDILISEPLARGYVTMQTGVAAISLIDPAAPVVIDTLDLEATMSEVATMALEGNQLWIATGNDGVFGVSTDLELISHIPTPAEARDVAVSDGLLAVAEWDQGLQLFDSSNAAAPAWRGGIDLPGFAVAVALSGPLAYVVDLVGLTIIDVTQPASPMILGSIALPGVNQDLLVSGDRAYIASTKAMYVLDISDPHYPLLMGQLPGYSTRVIALDSQMVGLSRPVTLAVIDVSDPTAPMPLTEIYLELNTEGIAGLGSRIFIPSGTRLHVINHEQFAIPPVTGHLDQSSIGGHAVVREGNLAYVAGYDRLSVIDLSDPATPFFRGQLIDKIYPRTMALGSDFMYAFQEEECVVLNMADPDAPGIVGRAKSIDSPRDCVLAGDRLYVTGYPGLQVLDISDPLAPASLGMLSSLNPPSAIEADHQFLFLANRALDDHAHIQIIDPTDPEDPQAIGDIEIETNFVLDMALAGNFIYAVTGGNDFPVKFATIDISDPETPVLLAHTPLLSTNTVYSGRLQVAGSVAYVAINDGVQIIDVSTPASPRVIGIRFDIRETAIDVTGDWLLAADFSQFLVLPLQCQTPSPVELSSFEAAPIPGAIRLTWHTSREWDHLGFYVERSGATAGNYHRLTELIPPPGPYTYLDRAVAPGVTYFYRLAALDRGGRIEFYGPISATAAVTANAPPPKPTIFQLAQSYPNPFEIGDQETAIAYSLAAPGRARLRVFDATGRLVATLVNAELPAGEHLATWDGRTVRGETAPAGTYFYRLEAGSYSATQQLVRLR